MEVQIKDLCQLREDLPSPEEVRGGLCFVIGVVFFFFSAYWEVLHLIKG